MKILVLQDLYPPPVQGGYGEACRNMVNLLVRRGHKILVLTATEGPDEILSNLEIRRRLRSNAILSVFIRVLGYGYRRRRNEQEFRNALDEFVPDVVFVWNLSRFSDALLMSLQLSGYPIVYYVHDYWMLVSRERRWNRFWSQVPARRVRRLIKATLRAIGAKSLGEALLRSWFSSAPPPPSWRRVRFVSKSCLEEYVEAGFDVECSGVIYNGIDLHHFRPPNRRVRGEALKLLFVGRVEPKKGAHTVVDALARLERRYGIRAKLSLVGPIDEERYPTRLKALAAAGEVTDRIEYHGSVAYADLPEKFHLHDVLVFSSIADERFPLVILEGMATGLPVVSTLTGGHREYLKHEQNCLVYPPGDVEALTEHLKRLARDQKLAARLGEAGLKTVRERFDLERIGDQVESWLEDIVLEAKVSCG